MTLRELETGTPGDCGPPKAEGEAAPNYAGDALLHFAKSASSSSSWQSA